MIFRIDGEVGELLALTPILREWRRRNVDDCIRVETYTPEIYAGNLDIIEAGPSISCLGKFFDMNLIRWRELGGCVAGLYAQMVFGDRNLTTWRISMTATDADQTLAESILPKTDKVRVAVGFDVEKIDTGVCQGVKDELGKAGYEVFDVSVVRPWGVVYAVISMADLFIGSDGDVSAIALATQTPAVVCYSYRSPFYFPPFRVDVPFVSITPERSFCEHAGVCHSRYSRVEYSDFYSQDCVKVEKFCCRKRDLRADVMEAVRKIGDKA